METNDTIEGGESAEQMSSDIIERDATTDLATISFHNYLCNITGTTMKFSRDITWTQGAESG